LWQTVNEYPNTSCNFYGNNGADCTDGTTMFPGTDPRQPSNDPQTGGPLASIRFKFWRRGMQDYEYLWLLRQSGQQDLASTIETAVVPKALYDTEGLGTPNSWSPYGYVFEAQREAMARALGAGVTATEITRFEAHPVGLGTWLKELLH
jgi:hypothetical protein